MARRLGRARPGPDLPGRAVLDRRPARSDRRRLPGLRLRDQRHGRDRRAGRDLQRGAGAGRPGRRRWPANPGCRSGWASACATATRRPRSAPSPTASSSAARWCAACSTRPTCDAGLAALRTLTADLAAGVRSPAEPRAPRSCGAVSAGVDQPRGRSASARRRRSRGRSARRRRRRASRARRRGARRAARRSGRRCASAMAARVVAVIGSGSACGSYQASRQIRPGELTAMSPLATRPRNDVHEHVGQVGSAAVAGELVDARPGRRSRSRCRSPRGCRG